MLVLKHGTAPDTVTFALCCVADRLLMDGQTHGQTGSVSERVMFSFFLEEGRGEFGGK